MLKNGKTECLLATVCLFLAVPFAAPQNASRAGAGSFLPLRHKLEISDPILAAEIVARGGRLLADYGGYQLYGLDQPNSEILSHGNAQLRDRYHQIRLNAAILDTSQPQVQSLRRILGAYAGKRLHLVQLVGPPQPAWHQTILDTGVEIAGYIPHNAYLIYGDAHSLGQLQALARAANYVQWDGEYLDDYKIHPKARDVDSKGNPRKIETDWFAIQLVVDGAANPATLQVIEQLSLAAGRDTRRIEGPGGAATPSGRRIEIGVPDARTG